MAITYTNKPIDWDNEGTTPPQDLIETGFVAGYKPPAEYFNAILHTNAEAIKELQEKTADFSVTVDGYMIDSGFIDATCTYAADTGYTLTFDTDVSSASYFCVRFKAPNDYVADATFTIGTTAYTAVNASFDANDVVILNFDKVQQKCFFAGGGESYLYVNAHKDYILKPTISEGATGTLITGVANKIDEEKSGAGNTSGTIMFGEGNTCSGGICSLFGGNTNTVAGNCTFVTGGYNTIYSNGSLIVGGYCKTGAPTTITGETYTNNSTTRVSMIGEYLKANDYNNVIGKYNKTPTAASLTATTGDLFIVGNGLSSSRTNALRVAADGNVYGTKAYTASGADYSEMFQWEDDNANNEDRRGLFVTLDGEKIRLANTDDDYILGVVSATPSVVADAHTDDWCKKWKTDIFGERLLDENGAWILNEDFKEEENENYVSRLDRKEWAAIGLVGKLIVVDDGTCEVNGYCYPKNGGVATKTEKGYRVIARIDESHVKVIIK